MSIDREPPETAVGAWAKRRHFAAFVLCGLLAYAVDSGLLALGIWVVGLDARVARFGGIATAMVVSWLCQRRWTFAVSGPPTLREFIRFAGAAWLAAAVNYAVFAAIIFCSPTVWPQIALIAATTVATIVSYLSMRYGVFRSTKGLLGP